MPVLLTDGNIHVLYINNPRLDVHQRLYWDFDNIFHAANYLEDLVKKLAADNPAPCGYDPTEEDDPDPQGDASMRDFPPPDYYEHSLGGRPLKRDQAVPSALPLPATAAATGSLCIAAS